MYEIGQLGSNFLRRYRVHLLKMNTGNSVSARATIRKKWEESHEHLQHALQGYLDACLELEADCDRPSSSLDDEAELAISLGLIKHKMSYIDSDRDLLHGALSSLKRARNRSSKDVPSRRLPPELLTRIFTMVISVDKVDSEIAGPIPRVCHHWRQLAIQTCELWSHIDVGITDNMFDGCIPLMMLWLERVGKAPLNIHLHAGRMRQFAALEQAIKPLTQRVTQFRSLNITSYSANLLAFVVDLWLNDDTSCPLNNLVLIRQRGSRDGDEDCAFPPKRPSFERICTLLEGVRILVLRDTYLDWDLVAFRSLVELDLRSIKEKSGPTVEQLYNLLTANPELRRFYVEFITIHPIENYIVTPVQLAKLKTLEVGSFSDESLVLLLDLLEPLSPDFGLTFQDAYSWSTEESTAVENFCSRVNLAALCFKRSHRSNIEVIAELVVKLPSLKTLVLDSVALTENFFHILAHAPQTTPSHKELIDQDLLSDKFALQNLNVR
ncbi:hypothetical protein BDV93DRAFT_548838 [Ceratobasidium sp. AG-I]|nr:hypothetical protein BDV93DRAFT_548838 [Ceratobasidium sp. AG-I]